MENCFQSANCFTWVKIISALICLKYWYHNTPYLGLPCLPNHLCHFLPWPTQILFQHNLYHVLYWFLYFVLPHSTRRHHKYLIYQAICRSKTIKSDIRLYTDHNSFNMGQTHYLSKRWVFKRSFSLSNLDNTVNKNSIFSTKYAEYSTKW